MESSNAFMEMSLLGCLMQVYQDNDMIVQLSRAAWSHCTPIHISGGDVEPWPLDNTFKKRSKYCNRKVSHINRTVTF